MIQLSTILVKLLIIEMRKKFISMKYNLAFQMSQKSTEIALWVSLQGDWYYLPEPWIHSVHFCRKWCSFIQISTTFILLCTEGTISKILKIPSKKPKENLVFPTTLLVIALKFVLHSTVGLLLPPKTSKPHFPWFS